MTFIRLEDRICINLLTAGTLSDGGKLPVCLGPQCSSFEKCSHELLNNLIEYENLRISPSYKSVIQYGKYHVGLIERNERKKKSVPTTTHRTPATIAASGLNPLDYS